MRVKIAEIRKTLETALIKHGVPKEEAKVVADEYLESELQGKLSHGLMAFPSAVKKISRKTGKIKILKKTNAFIFMDANANFGAAVGKKAVNLAVKMAKKEGVGVVVIKNLTTWLRPGTIARWIAEKGFLGFVVNSGGWPMVAPPGGYKPVIGTNPIGIGLPTAKEPLVADMATSKKAWGEVRLSKKFGHDLPGETFFDKKGGFAQKSEDAYSALPAGDYKGFALGLFVEILTGSLIDKPMGPQQMKGDYRTFTRGGFILVINPQKTTNLKKFKKANTKLFREIKRSPKLKGTKEILMPEERAMRTRKKHLEKGSLEVDEKLWEEIRRNS